MPAYSMGSRTRYRKSELGHIDMIWGRDELKGVGLCLLVVCFVLSTGQCPSKHVEADNGA